MDGVLSNATLVAYFLVFLEGLVTYIVTSKAALRSVDSLLFYTCILLLNTWVPVLAGSNTGHFLTVLLMV
jgi:hypothetical protein